jgi:hypothetical protein
MALSSPEIGFRYASVKNKGNRRPKRQIETAGCGVTARLDSRDLD